MKHIILGLVAFGAALAPAMAMAERGEMLRPARYGTVREVVGDDLPMVNVRDNCPAAQRPIVDGPCFDGIKASATAQRVLAVIAHYRPGERIAGTYGRDFQLFDVRQGAKGIEARALPFTSSDIQVPRDCFALNDEGIGYVLDTVNGATVAQESQYVVCGGGADHPNGPYRPSGPVMRSDLNGWGRSQIVLAEGQHRYLAMPDSSCDPAFVVKDKYCAKPAVLFMNANPDTKELDLIAALAPVRAGDIVTDKDIKQWVMKRSSGGYKADSRWFSKSMFSDGNGCWAAEPVRWYVDTAPDGLDITEKAMSRCGAPMAPVPTALYVVYGEEYGVLNCSGDACAGPAADYMRHEKLKSATFVTLRRQGGYGGHISSGYDVIYVELKNDVAKVKSGSASTVSEPGCNASDSTDPDAQGFVLSHGRARAYRWMECAVY